MPAHDDGAHAVRWQPDQGSTTARPEITKFYRLMKMHGMGGEPADDGQQQDENNSHCTLRLTKAAELRYLRREAPLPAHHGPRSNRQACRRNTAGTLRMPYCFALSAFFSLCMSRI